VKPRVKWWKIVMQKNEPAPRDILRARNLQTIQARVGIYAICFGLPKGPSFSGCRDKKSAVVIGGRAMVSGLRALNWEDL
jgi:hypothetical protein